MSSASGGTIYPRYCFELAPTFNTWCLLRAVDIHNLAEHDDGFKGEMFYFRSNHPIKWVRVVGVVVAIDEIAGRRFYTIDDSSGACIEAMVSIPAADNLPNGDVQSRLPALPEATATTKLLPQQPQFADIDVGVVVDVKGRLDSFRDEKQIRIEKMRRLRSTMEEMALWEKRAAFERDVLNHPWVLRRRDVRRCRKEAQQSQEKAERKKKRLETVTGGSSSRDSIKPGPPPQVKDKDAIAHKPTASDLREIIKHSAGLGTYSALGL